MSEIYACTFLVCEPGHRLTKLYHDPSAEPQDYDAGSLFQALEWSGSWEELVDTLGSLPTDACLIRGGVRAEARPDVEAGEHVRRLAYGREDCDAAFEAAPRNWIVLDADHTDAPFDLESPDASIRAWHATLPEPVRSARSAFFPSASAHRSPTVRGKLLVALDAPVSNADAAAFARAHGFDPSVSHTVAINYFAPPVFQHGADPLGVCREPTLFDGEPMATDTILNGANPRSIGGGANGVLGERAPAGALEADATDRAIELAAMIADRWLEGNRVEGNAWLHLAGWCLGAGWSRGEMAAVLECLDDDEPSRAKRAEHVHILRNARAIEGPGGAREWLGDDFETVDRLVNRDPVIEMMIAMREARELEATATDPFHPAVPGDAADNGLVLTTDKQGKPVASCDNVFRWLEAVVGARIRFEECTGRVTVADCPDDWGLPDGAWTDTHTTRLRRMLDGDRLYVSKDVVNDCVTAHAKAHAHNVLTDYALQCAEKWDGVRRIDRAMATYWGAPDNAASGAVGRVFLMSLAARALDPGCKVDTALLLIGGQGIRKSSSLRALAGAALFSDSPLPIGDKDALQVIRGKWLWEIAENASASRKDRNAVKAFLAASEDTFRASYGRFSETVPRQCTFAVSSNDAEPLNDPTGARRYLPIILSRRIDVDAIERDREQLLGEAAWRVLEGEQWWATDDEDAALAESRHLVTETTEQSDTWDEPIAIWVDARRTYAGCGLVGEDEADDWEPPSQVTPFSVADVLHETTGAIPMALSQTDRQAQMRVANILRRLGLTKMRTTRGGRRAYLWS